MIYTTAVCESCSKPQPKDWQAGQLCIHCGNAVRREVRCFWCVTWTPAAKYCRKCGADVIEPELFGVARMLKDAGTDRFTIPKLIREFDSGRIETFRSLYLAQAAILEAHVADLRFVESHLLQKDWSGELESELLAQLPWPEKQIPTHRHATTLVDIAERSPFAITRQLAQIASAKQDAAMGLYSNDPRIQDEAALALTHWRVTTSRNLDAAIEPILRNSRFRDAADVRLAYKFPRLHPLRLELLGSADPEIAFMAALAAGDEAMLTAAATDPHRDELTRYAACERIAFDGPLGEAIAKALPGLEPEHQVDVLDTIARRKQAVPALTRMLLQLMEETEDRRVRQRAGLVLCRDMSYETAIAVIPFALQDSDIAADLLRSSMPPEAMAILGERLVDDGKFGSTRWGMDAAAKPGRMPEQFVPAVYGNVKDEKTRCELIRFAEMQIDARERQCPELIDFLTERCFAEPEGKAQAEAWSSMSRIRHRDSPANVVPFEMAVSVVERVFGSVDRFLSLFSALLLQSGWRDNVSIFDPLSRFIRYVDEGIYEKICESREADRYLDAMVTLLEDANLRGFTRNNAIYPLIGIARACPARQPGIISILERLNQNVYELKSETDYALRRIRGELG